MTEDQPREDQASTPESAPVDAPTPQPEPAEPAPAEAVPEPGPGPEPSVPPPGSGLEVRMILLGIGTAIVAVAVVLLVLMVFAPSIAPIKLGAVADAARVREQGAVSEVAERFSTSLYTFNYRTIDADLDRIRADATGSFSTELEQVLGEVDVFKEAIVDAQGESSGEVLGVDVRDAEGDTARARVFVLQTIRNKREPEPRPQFSAVELTLVKTGGGWKVDDVKQFRTGAPEAFRGR